MTSKMSSGECSVPANGVSVSCFFPRLESIFLNSIYIVLFKDNAVVGYLFFENQIFIVFSFKIIAS